MLLIQDSDTDEVLGTTYNPEEAATVSTPDVKRPTLAAKTTPMTLRQKLLARSTEITAALKLVMLIQQPVTQQPPVPRPSAACKQSVAWGEALRTSGRHCARVARRHIVYQTRFTGCDGPVSQRMQQQPIDAANVKGPSLWVHADARKRQHWFACHSEWPTPRESCTGRGLGGDDARGQAALKTGDMARARRGSRHKTETVDVEGSHDGCGLEADSTANAQRESSSGKTTSSATRVHGGTGRRTGSTARAGAQRGTQHGPDTVVAGCGEDCRELEADRMAADSVESRNGLAARDEASGHGGTRPRFGGTARAQRVTNHGAKVLEVTAGDGTSQLGEGACQATCHDPGVLRVAGGNRGSKLGSGGSARASRVSDGGITKLSKMHGHHGPETGIGDVGTGLT